MCHHQLCRKVVQVNTIKWKIVEKVSIFRKFLRFIWERIMVCSTGNSVRYRRLSSKFSEELLAVESSNETLISGYDSDSDLVALKISILGDCQIGKTSFVIKYVGDEQEKRCLEMKGLNLMDKTLIVRGARISFRIWDVGGNHNSYDQIPIACKNSVAILFMFDLTSRSTLNNVIDWYSEARKWNQTAIPILIGTKFDDFVQLPLDIQWSVVTQARAYAKAMKASLFFSSATHNINVNKIFKFIMAKLFNLPWTVQRNLTIATLRFLPIKNLHLHSYSSPSNGTASLVESVLPPTWDFSP
ncbi:septum-promoting GTP-binding protein 1-like isoform X1 [Nicotiana sylvestris]|uniref:Septum-promoting GTP-binding protein 1-like isoform X1 n=1 Tax=Nicotiana sylvestris TaxID=4096 RepID=A0A1U7YM88_NICSY|nr:PREDICTED: septum-promoting GTP-binding protein 1-like isoform X1 [Nicotiana sylvestris]